MKDLSRLSEESLAEAIKMTADELRSLAQKAPRLYRERKQAKKAGGFRLIAAPHDNLKTAQRDLLHGILEHLPVSARFFGRAGSSAIQAAQLHVNKPMVVTMDIKDFFPSVSSGMVHEMFRRRGASQVVAHLLTRMVTRKGHLPQGAPTSSCVAALVLNPVANDIESTLRSVGPQDFSIYADDVAVSGPNGLKRIKGTIIRIFKRHDFLVHPSKIRVMPSKVDQEVLGLIVNDGLKVSPAFQVKYQDAIAELGTAHPTVTGMRDFVESVSKASKTAYRTVCKVRRKEDHSLE